VNLKMNERRTVPIISIGAASWLLPLNVDAMLRARECNNAAKMKFIE
jgi:hypothetical protein